MKHVEYWRKGLFVGILLPLCFLVLFALYAVITAGIDDVVESIVMIFIFMVVPATFVTAPLFTFLGYLYGKSKMGPDGGRAKLIFRIIVGILLFMFVPTILQMIWSIFFSL